MRLRGLAMAFLVIGCSDPSGVVYALEDFEVTVSLSTATVREQQPTTVTVTVTNVGTARRTLSTGCVRTFIVETADGARVGPNDFACARTGTVELAPGEQVTFEESWRGEGYRPTFTEPRLVPPGTYLLRGVVWPVPRSYGGAKTAMLEPVVSEPVEVAMLPPY